MGIAILKQRDSSSQLSYNQKGRTIFHSIAESSHADLSLNSKTVL